MASTIVGAKVIVVGGGLAGLSAAHTVLERGGRVLVLDKKNFLGGSQRTSRTIPPLQPDHCIAPADAYYASNGSAVSLTTQTP